MSSEVSSTIADEIGRDSREADLVMDVWQRVVEACTHTVAEGDDTDQIKAERIKSFDKGSKQSVRSLVKALLSHMGSAVTHEAWHVGVKDARLVMTDGVSAFHCAVKVSWTGDEVSGSARIPWQSALPSSTVARPLDTRSSRSVVQGKRPISVRSTSPEQSPDSTTRRRRLSQSSAGSDVIFVSTAKVLPRTVKDRRDTLSFLASEAYKNCAVAFLREQMPTELLEGIEHDLRDNTIFRNWMRLDSAAKDRLDTRKKAIRRQRHPLETTFGTDTTGVSVSAESIGTWVNHELAGRLLYKSIKCAFKVSAPDRVEFTKECASKMNTQFRICVDPAQFNELLVPLSESPDGRRGRPSKTARPALETSAGARSKRTLRPAHDPLRSLAREAISRLKEVEER